MLSLNKIIADIRNIATSGSNPIEFKIEEKQIEFWINEVRSTLISQAISKRQDISDTWVQIISCLDLELADQSECCIVDTGCYVLKSVQKIPDTIETWMDNTILKVTKPDGTIISKSNPFRSRYSSYAKYTKNKPEWYLRNGYLYVINETFLEKVNVWGVFENPADLFNFTSCNGGSCFNYEDEYPCSLKMAEQITDIVLKTRVYPFLQLPADNRNDAANINDTPTNTKGL